MCVPWQALALVALYRLVIHAAAPPGVMYFDISRVVVFGYEVSDCRLREWSEMDPRLRQTPRPCHPPSRGSPRWTASWLGEPCRVVPVLHRQNCNTAVELGEAYLKRKPMRTVIDGETKRW